MYVVRPLRSTDLANVEAIIASTDLFPKELLGPMTAPFFSQEDSAGHWAVVERDVERVGPIGVAYWVPERMTTGTWNLLLIAVHSASQRQGVGAALVDYVEQQLRSGGERILLVETSGLAEFGSTRLFYEKRGFAEEARIRDFYDDGNDKIVFRKPLFAN